MKLILQGGGSYPDAKDVEMFFFNSVFNKILYIPIAMIGGYDFDQCFDYINGIKNDLRKNISIDMITDLSKLSDNLFKEYDGIYIGGGNTFKLWNDINTFGAREKILRYLNDGGVVYGGSAGAIIFGNNINTSSDANVVNLHNVDGFNLVNNYSIFCHYEDKNFQEVNLYVESYGISVIALRENAGICYNGAEIKAIGREEVLVFKPGRIVEYL